MIWHEIHRLIYILRSELLLFAARLLPSKSETCNNAMDLLKEAGYDFHEPWGELPPLPQGEKDLSIVIPVYNSEQFLDKCLSSILNQHTNYDYEVICVNDGSTDGSANILQKWAEKDARLVIITQTNQGIAGARNTGIARAKGRYIGFIDNDDYVEPNYVECILDRAKETGADIIDTAYDNVSPEGSILSVVSHGDIEITPDQYVEQMRNLPSFIWGGCMSRRLLEEVRFPIGFWYEDMVMRMLFVRQTNKIATISKPLYHYLIHGNNASLTLWKRNHIKATDELWLALQLAEYGQKRLGISTDEYLYTALLDEWSSLLWVRTKGLPVHIRKAIFNLAANYMRELAFPILSSDRYYNAIDRAILNYDFRKWKLLGKALLLKRCSYL